MNQNSENITIFIMLACSIVLAIIFNSISSHEENIIKYFVPHYCFGEYKKHDICIPGSKVRISLHRDRAYDGKFYLKNIKADTNGKEIEILNWSINYEEEFWRKKGDYPTYLVVSPWFEIKLPDTGGENAETMTVDYSYDLFTAVIADNNKFDFIYKNNAFSGEVNINIAYRDEQKILNILLPIMLFVKFAFYMSSALVFLCILYIMFSDKPDSTGSTNFGGRWKNCKRDI